MFSTGTSCIPRRCQLVPHPGLALLSSKHALHGPFHLPMSFTSIRVLIIKWVKSQSLIPALYPIIESLESTNEDVHNKNHPQIPNKNKVGNETMHTSKVAHPERGSGNPDQTNSTSAVKYYSPINWHNNARVISTAVTIIIEMTNNSCTGRFGHAITCSLQIWESILESGAHSPYCVFFGKHITFSTSSKASPTHKTSSKIECILVGGFNSSERY